ncbi:tryptophan transporter [Clostridium aestuarii]|uniref:Tryptophan transporter n=1 Tax=Clostridium aestuarii TaxID=338193 RepID=A0ABT4CZC0_9CLOT|nr:tryptophan transporter [Clostridium aestuarii]MCY6484336.1 tryptophan transporter [Clostridium aestuarii]
MNLDLRKSIINSLILAIGFILRQISPPLLFGMKPDLLLTTMFIIILINKEYKTTLITGIICGILAALTTNFPGGQLPNIIDKIITSHFIYFIIIPLLNKFSNQIKVIICSLLGTLISGFVFLLSASILVGLPGSVSLSALFTTVVIPTALVNTIGGAVIFNAIQLSFKRSNINVF